MAATILASTTAVPSRTIKLQEAVQWVPGEKIVLVTTFWKDEDQNQNEVIGSVARDTLRYVFCC